MTENFNIEPMLNEIKNVIDNGLHNLLNDFMGKYTEYEENYNAVLNLPAVKNRINILKHEYSNSNNYGNSNSNNNSNIINTMYKTFNVQMKQLQKENDELKAQIDKLKQNMPPIFDLTKDDEYKTVIKIKEEPNINNENENENITLKFEEQINKEDESVACLESVKSLEEEESQEEESEEEESQEEESVDEESVDEELVDEEEESVAGLEEELVEEESVEESVAGLEEELVEELVEEEVEEEDESVAGLEEESVEEEELVKEESVEEDNQSVETETKEEESVKSLDEEEVEEELFEIEIDDKPYCTNNEETGFIYELDSDGDVGEKIGYFKEGEAIFYSEE